MFYYKFFIFCDSDQKGLLCSLFDTFSSRQEAKDAGWMLCRDGRSYCPFCAFPRRHVGRSGKPRNFI